MRENGLSHKNLIEQQVTIEWDISHKSLNLALVFMGTGSFSYSGLFVTVQLLLILQPFPSDKYSVTNSGCSNSTFFKDYRCKLTQFPFISTPQGPAAP